MTRYLPESSILKPKDPTLVEDDWPIFVLSDAIVYRPDGVTLANAVLVAQEGPCIVRGRLEVDDKEDIQYLVKPTVRTANIEAKGIENYSIGDDPQGVVWLASSAGWFEISPHPSYERIYRSMCDMTVLYYILLGIYIKACEGADSKSKHRILATLDIKEILFEYAVALGNGTTYEEAVDMCVQLGPMLLAHFARSKDLDWVKSSFAKWLVKELKDRERSARSSSRSESAAPVSSHSQVGFQAETQALRPGTTPVPPPQLPSAPSAQAATPGLSQQLPFRAPPGVAANGNGGSSQVSPVPLPTYASREQSVSGSPASAVQSAVPRELRDSVFKVYLEVIEAIGAAHGDPRKVSAGKVHYGVFTKFKVRNYNLGKHLSALFSSELLASLSDSWHGSPYEAWLTSKEALEFTPTSATFLADVPNQLVRRAHQAPSASSSASTAPSSAKGPSTAQTNSPVLPSPRISGKRAVLRLPTVSKKRRFEGAFGEGRPSSADNGDSADAASAASRGSTPRPVGRPRKTAKNNHDDGDRAARHPSSQAMQVDISSDDDSSSSDDNSAGDSDSERQKKETILAVRAEPLLISTRPTGPNRTWTCPQPGCSYFVRDAGSPDLSDNSDEDDDDDGSDDNTKAARSRIIEHLRSHEKEMLSRVDLAITEGTRGHVSVDHLLEKIRTLADKNSQRTAAASTASSTAVTPTAVTSGTSWRSRFFY
ncbi:uncharacterized protein SPSK_05026 [Sporothrix schenckii 1099-18]|uniref:DNA (cytosine-5)-methyltransferase 1 replication foci domain-containing protein n=1 Tax=Sporothrix schenckii 1099-18 TaxID=1397361 RepID=A0A0F2LV48_SPOSC|nr:uncharacterized protein SPSK_05026 [Sporothrix schenckii 1099-18]KJR80714.1 hypothetical protein SPSK_05026 [Sporothrix schenckii 1099-18]